ncbi:HD domain-containing protein [Heliobacterium gestii]|uniref:HD domain-containing protein n=1 Tax=Heliomicrobium gestii TaxID=2699 RepID=A0A845LI06_HELGE|nr:HD domain-containing phosphohydrolase [Heliomicrobium gestii]MBM7868516.1 HD-GYP domain-containing protein (c-di-GMP phosphodiesterase class II) [Heliomicrobium gestii]MZP44670.1 HD domain-containing protein [Heliomicrobium gestii]
MIVTINLPRLLNTLSMVLDFTTIGLNHHHNRVAYISSAMGAMMDLSPQERHDLYCAASIHDMGATSFHEKAALGSFQPRETDTHCQAGYQLLKGIGHFENIAQIILHHHDHWEHQEERSALTRLSDIIHLADRLEILLTGDYILHQRRRALDQLSGWFGTMFRPELKEVLSELAVKESFWLDLASPYVEDLSLGMMSPEINDSALQYKDLKKLFMIFAWIIDRKCRFTMHHSRLVASSSAHLASLAGFSPLDIAQIEVAGLLHDLGKLSIPESILEKPGALTAAEYDVIKRHPYHTYHILRRLPGHLQLAEWAAFHHERPNGAGYPFRIGGSALPLGSRIIAVADIFSALIEDRPYRTGMNRGDIESILSQSAREKALDGDLVDQLLSHYDLFASLQEFVDILRY